jgi:uncharacterized cupin superfamily protein
MTDNCSFAILDPDLVPPKVGAAYPKPFSAPCRSRSKRALGDALGLKQFGVNWVELPPGCWSAQRHWHHEEDEFVMIVKGEVTLVTDEGEQVMCPGQVTGFPSKNSNSHHLINLSSEPACYLEVGTRSSLEKVEYPDIDMKMVRKAGEKSRFFNRKGDPL